MSTESRLTAPAVEFRDLSFRYAGAERLALRGVNLRLAPGELVLITGGTGAGKSTLALAANGLIPHLVAGELSGAVTIAGLDTAEHDVCDLGAKVGLVFQDPDSQFASLVVEDELAFGPENLCLPPPEVARRVEEALGRLGIAHLRRRFVYELSGGQKQRVAIAAVLAMQPAVLILDEPTSNLDPAGATEVLQAVQRLRALSPLTVLVIENRLDDLISEADRLVVLADGAVVADGPPRQVLSVQGEELQRLGVQLPAVSEMALRLRAAGLPLAAFPLTPTELAHAIPPRAFTALPSRPPAAAEPAPAPVIAVDRLSYTYPSGQPALTEVSFAVGAGDIVGLLGQNGSGKTTLALHLVGLLQPTGGGGVVCGHPLGRTPIRTLAAEVGYVFQYPEHQFVTDNVRDEVAFGPRALEPNLPKGELRERVQATLEALGLTGLEARHPFSLSTGQKRRLSVATALVLQPRVLILDEPTTGQDRRHTEDMVSLLLDLNARGVTLLLITHDLDLVAEHARTVVALDAGRLAYAGPARELFDRLDDYAIPGLAAPPLRRAADAIGALLGRHLPCLTRADFLRLVAAGSEVA